MKKYDEKDRQQKKGLSEEVAVGLHSKETGNDKNSQVKEKSKVLEFSRKQFDGTPGGTKRTQRGENGAWGRQNRRFGKGWVGNIPKNTEKIPVQGKAGEKMSEGRNRWSEHDSLERTELKSQGFS